MATKEQVQVLVDFAKLRAPPKILMCPKCRDVRVAAEDEGRLRIESDEPEHLRDLYEQGVWFCSGCRVAFVSYRKE